MKVSLGLDTMLDMNSLIKYFLNCLLPKVMCRDAQLFWSRLCADVGIEFRLPKPLLFEIILMKLSTKVEIYSSSWN
jgi:hypothetical protein